MAKKKTYPQIPVDNQLFIARAMGEIFQRKLDFLVLGLTGRTGCGCSTVVEEVLSKQRFEELHWPRIGEPSKDHETRKDRIVEDWLKKHWAPFRKIQISNLIFYFAIIEEPSEFIAFIIDRLGFDIHQELISFIKKSHQEASKFKQYITNIQSINTTDTIEAARFYFDRLPELGLMFKEMLTKMNKECYTKIFQELGDNIRKSGSPFIKIIRSDALFVIPKCIENIISLGKILNNSMNITQHYFAIDAIRHPFEIHYLRERVNRFFVVAVTVEEKVRRNRLIHKVRLSMDAVETLDKKEYSDENLELTDYDHFVSQNIQTCIAASDIYLPNSWEGPEASTDGLQELTRSLGRYIALAQHPGLITPTSGERCMQVAFASALNSGCISRQVGAVVTDQSYSIKAVGWNDVPKGQVPCLLRYSRDLYKGDTDEKAFSIFERGDNKFKKDGLSKYRVVHSQIEEVDGRHITFCFRSVYNKAFGSHNQIHTRALHAEENAFLQISKSGGQGITGGFLFTTASPCELCAKKAYQLELSKIFYIDPYPGISSTHIFGAGKTAPLVILFSGVIGKAYHELYEPIMPYKDEIATLIPASQQLSPRLLEEPI